MQTEIRNDTGLPNAKHSPLTRIVLERFTAFEQLDLKLGPGINVFIGANGTGKTHLLKVAYAACEFKTTNIDYVMGPEGSFYHKLIRVFLPSRNSIQRLVRHPSKDRQAIVEVWRGHRRLRFPISDEARRMGSFAKLDWPDVVKSVFIPAKEMLSHAPGFRSLYEQREIHFEEIHSDVIDHAYLPPLRRQKNAVVRGIEKRLEDAIGGRVAVEGEEFFIENGNGKVEFMLLADGLRKLGLLWLLVRNGSLPNGSVLFWDEPEENLNPGLLTVVVDVLLQLQRSGVQILIATHDYAVLKELELLIEEGDEVRFHSLYQDSTGEVSCESASRPFKLRHSPIAEAFTSLYDREIQRSLGKRRRTRMEQSLIADDGSVRPPNVAEIIAELDERGYCIIPSVISVEKADRVRAILERILADEESEISREKKTQRVARIAVKHPIFVELMSHPLIVAIWRRYLDEDMICSTWTANTTYPGYSRYGWHPDWPYQRLNQPWPTDRISGQTMWLLNDFSAENGGTGIIPCSHRKGHRPPPEIASDWHPDGEILTAVRGSVMVMHGATWHTARPNRSNAARSALLGMYTRPIYVTQEDMRAQLADLDNPSELVRQLMGANQHQPGVVHKNQ